MCRVQKEIKIKKMLVLFSLLFVGTSSYHLDVERLNDLVDKVIGASSELAEREADVLQEQIISTPVPEPPIRFLPIPPPFGITSPPISTPVVGQGIPELQTVRGFEASSAQPVREEEATSLIENIGIALGLTTTMTGPDGANRDICTIKIYRGETETLDSPLGCIPRTLSVVRSAEERNAETASSSIPSGTTFQTINVVLRYDGQVCDDSTPPVCAFFTRTWFVNVPESIARHVDTNAGTIVLASIISSIPNTIFTRIVPITGNEQVQALALPPPFSSSSSDEGGFDEWHLAWIIPIVIVSVCVLFGCGAVIGCWIRGSRKVGIRGGEETLHEDTNAHSVMFECELQTEIPSIYTYEPMTFGKIATDISMWPAPQEIATNVVFWPPVPGNFYDSCGYTSGIFSTDIMHEVKLTPGGGDYEAVDHLIPTMYQQI